MRQIDELFASVFKPRPTERIEEWAKRHIMLSTKESLEFPGPYDPGLSPHATILFDVALDPEYNEFCCRKSSQSSFTLHCLILICYWVVFYNRNIIYTIDTRDEVRRISQERLQPMLKACGAAAGKIPQDEDKMTNLTLSLKGLVIYLSGAQSVGALANKSAGLAICDEVDAYVASDSRTESHPVHLVRDRLKKVTDSFFIEISKPDQEGGQITQDFLTGTRHQCFVPCPHCKEFQVLDFFGYESQTEESGIEGGLRADHCKDLLGGYDLDRVLTDTYYECRHCGEAIREESKPWMLQQRDWRRTNFGQDKWKPKPGRFSCEISDLYSTFPTASWGQLMVEWLDAQGSQDKIDNFLRGRLGKPVVKESVKVEEAHVLALIGDYERGHCPVPPDLVLMGVDKQGDRYKWVKVAYVYETDEIYTVDYGECLSENDIIEAADIPVVVDHWGDTPEESRINPVVVLGLVDEKYKRYVVRNFCQQTATGDIDHRGQPQLRFYPAQGVAKMRATARDIVVEYEKQTQSGMPITAYHFSNDAFLTMLYEHAIAGRKKLLKQRAEGMIPPAPLLHLMRDPEASFLSELMQERRRKVLRAGQWVEEWDPETPDANDFGDALKLCFIEVYIVKPFISAAYDVNQEDDEDE